MEIEKTGEIQDRGNANFSDYAIHRPQVIAEQVLKHPSLCCSITMPVQQYNANSQYTDSITTTFPFYMSDDFGFGISSEYKPLVDPDGAFSSLNDLIMKGSALTDGTQVSLQSRPMSALMWKGSKFNGFNINCVFVCTNRLINPANIIRTLAATVLPTSLNTGDKSLGMVGNAVAFGRAATALGSDSIFNMTMSGAELISSGLKSLFNNTIGEKADAVKNDVGKLWEDAKTSVNNSSVGNAIINSKYAEQQGEINKNAINELKKAAQVVTNTNWKDSIDAAKKKTHNIIMSAGIVAPLHYGLQFTGTDSDTASTNSVGVQAKANTCVRLNIGSWFEADNLVVTNLSNVKFSKELVAPVPMSKRNDNDLFHVTPTDSAFGFPLYATCTIELSPIAMMDYDTFCGYFKNTSSQNMYTQLNAYAEL